MDSIFWESYNTCDIEGMGQFIDDGIEFYHDKGGLTETKSILLSGIKTNLCSDENFSLRRAEKTGTIQVFPMDNFGAIISGQHFFYVTQNGNPEFLDGLARFTHVWKEHDNAWKMTRILSYDHGPAPKNSDKTEIKLTGPELEQFIGTYEMPSSGKITITVLDDQLHIDAGNMKSLIYASTELTFFHKEAPLTFEFVKTSEDLVEKLIVRENGVIVEEGRKQI